MRGRGGEGGEEYWNRGGEKIGKRKRGWRRREGRLGIEEKSIV
jgi:hypothetical protein